MNAATRRAIEANLGARIESVRPLSGGDINEAFALTLSGAERAFAKCNARADPRMFEAEARGLRWLREASALRVPRVLAVSAVGTGEAARGDAPSPFLVLEWLEAGRRVPDYDERLGQGLAALHQAGAPGFGLDHDNFIGPLPQGNSASPSWAEFYRARRLEPQIARARGLGRLDAELERAFERLLSSLSDWVGPAEPAARLHGDLWAGNSLAADGQPALIDPAVYGGHREMDLAMMRLFGGYSPRVFEAYAAAHPLAAGHRERVSLYQLYPLLVHLNLFGSGYLGQVRAAVAEYVR